MDNELYYIKLKTGQDLIASFTEVKDHECVQLHEPLEVQISPENGFFCKDFLYLAEGEHVFIDMNDILFIAPAGHNSVSTYEKWRSQKPSKVERQIIDRELSESDEELEELFSAILESNHNTKH